MASTYETLYGYIMEDLARGAYFTLDVSPAPKYSPYTRLSYGSIPRSTQVFRTLEYLDNPAR